MGFTPPQFESVPNRKQISISSHTKIPKSKQEFDRVIRQRITISCFINDTRLVSWRNDLTSSFKMSRWMSQKLIVIFSDLDIPYSQCKFSTPKKETIFLFLSSIFLFWITTFLLFHHIPFYISQLVRFRNICNNISDFNHHIISSYLKSFTPRILFSLIVENFH